MKSQKDECFAYQPFKEREELIRKTLLLADKGVKNCSESLPEQLPPDPEMERRIFLDAMKEVLPIERDNCHEGVRRISPQRIVRIDEDAETLSRLRELVENGKGYCVADTPEYIEGTGYKVNPEIAKRLHRGDYSIQGYVDLHGLTAKDAEEAFNSFMKWAVDTGKRGVMVIHGRGLSSPSEPVLKNKLVEWLSRGPWRKWVIAYCSARRCDGGAGATYVLLRKKPISKRLKKDRKR